MSPKHKHTILKVESHGTKAAGDSALLALIMILVIFAITPRCAVGLNDSLSWKADVNEINGEELTIISMPDQEQTKESGVKEPDVIYVPTPQHVVNLMLELANVKKTDLLYDLGCGDGRIVVTAAKKYGCEALGVDINPVRVRESLANVKAANLENLVTIEQEDIFELDLSEVDVVTLYLLPDLNVRLIPQLEMMKPGSRIVSHDFDMLGVEPDMVVEISSRVHGESNIYLWTVPLNKEAPTARKFYDRGHRIQIHDLLSGELTYISNSVPIFVSIAAAILASFFWCLRKCLGVIKINLRIDRPRSQMTAEDAEAGMTAIKKQKCDGKTKAGD